jgi:hypothetical protein
MVTPKFGTSKEDISRVRKEVEDAIVAAEAEVRTAKAFREANQSICSHADRNGTTCQWCGKYFPSYSSGYDR